MFHKVTALVYALFGAMIGHKIATINESPTGSTILSIMIGMGIALAIYYVLRFLRFAESAMRREMVAAPVIFKSGNAEKSEAEARASFNK